MLPLLILSLSLVYPMYTLVCYSVAITVGAMPYYTLPYPTPHANLARLENRCVRFEKRSIGFSINIETKPRQSSPCHGHSKLMRSHRFSIVSSLQFQKRLLYNIRIARCSPTQPNRSIHRMRTTAIECCTVILLRLLCPDFEIVWTDWHRDGS